MSNLGQTQEPSKRLWACATLVALTLHLGLGAFAVARFQSNVDDNLGAPGIEISLDLAAPLVSPTYSPAGPDSDASAASPPVFEQKQAAKDTELPKDTPTETDDPDRLVRSKNVQAPQEEPEVKAAQATPSPESTASEATATPTLQAFQEAPKSVTREQGNTLSEQRVRATWQKKLVAHLDKHKRYPADRGRKNAEVLVNIILDRVGHVVSLSIVKGSGDSAFDEAALAMVRRSDPVPAPPPLIADEGLSFTLPVIFRVKGRN